MRTWCRSSGEGFVLVLRPREVWTLFRSDHRDQIMLEFDQDYSRICAPIIQDEGDDEDENDDSEFRGRGLKGPSSQ